MVIKLVKRDLKDSIKYYGPIQILIVVLFLGVGFFLNSVESSQHNLMNFMATLSMMSVFAVMFSLFILSILANIYILYTSIYGDRGYDLFTMPVSSGSIILSKLLTVSIWSILSAITAGFGMLLFLLMTGNIGNFMYGVSFITENFQIIFAQFDYSIFGLGAVRLITNGLFTSVLILLCGAAVNSSKIQKNRGVMAVVLYYVLSMVVSFVEAYFVPFNDPMAGIMMSTASNVGLIGYKLALVGFMVFGIKWLWENKLEIL